MKPIPEAVGMLQFELVRDKKGFNFMQPQFNLLIEKNSEHKFNILFAKKRLFNK